MATPHADRNLLFGILALQLDFVSRDGLIAGMNAWVLDKAKPLGQVLQEQGALAAAEVALLEPLVQQHLKRHGGDAEKSLAVTQARTKPRLLGPSRRRYNRLRRRGYVGGTWPGS